VREIVDVTDTPCRLKCVKVRQRFCSVYRFVPVKNLACRQISIVRKGTSRGGPGPTVASHTYKRCTQQTTRL